MLQAIGHSSDQAEALLLRWKAEMGRVMNAPNVQADSIGQLGNILRKQGHNDKALAMHSEQLQIALNIGNTKLEIDARNGLGKTSFSKAEYADAHEEHSKALQLARSIEDSDLISSSAIGLAAVLRRQDGGWRQAMELLEEVLKFAKGADLASAHCNLGLILKSRHRFYEAIQHFEKQREVAKQIQDRFQIMGSYNVLSGAYRGTGQFEVALELSKKHLALAEIDDNAGEMAQGHANLGILHRRLGNPEKSIQHNVEALEIAKRTGDRQMQVWASGNIGRAYESLADTKVGDEAVTYYQEALKFLEQEFEGIKKIQLEHRERQMDKMFVELGRALNCLGGVYLKLKDFVSAISKLTEAVGCLHKLEKSVGDIDDADSFRRSIFDGSPQGATMNLKNSHSMLQKTLMLSGRPKAAMWISGLGKARGLSHTLHSFSGDSGNLDNVQGALDKWMEDGDDFAWEQVQQQVRIVGATVVEYSIISEHEVVVWVVSKDGDLLHNQILEMREQISDLGLGPNCNLGDIIRVLQQVMGFTSGRQESEPSTPSSSVPSPASPGFGYFDWVDLGTKQDVLSSFERPYYDLNCRESKRAAWELELRKALEEVKTTKKVIDPRFTSRFWEMHHECFLIDDWFESLKPRIPNCIEKMRLNQPLWLVEDLLDGSLDHLIAKVEETSAFSFDDGFEDDGRGWQESVPKVPSLRDKFMEWGVSEQDQVIFKQSCDKLLDRLGLLQRLHSILLEPIRHVLVRGHEIIFIPQGPLFGIPWAALHDGADLMAGAVMQQDRNRRFLVQDHVIRQSPSLLCAMQLERQTKLSTAEGKVNQPIVVVGNPYSTLKPLQSALREAKRITGLLSNHHVGKEQDLAVVANTDTGRHHVALITGRYAQTDVVLESLKRSCWVHMACHSDHMSCDGETTLEGALLMAEEHGRMDSYYEDALCTLKQYPETWPEAKDSAVPISQDFKTTTKMTVSLMKKRQTSLSFGSTVVLSACDSGRGDVRLEGVVGLSRAFFEARASGVVATCWTIPDRGTNVFMDLFYGELKEGHCVAVALQKATISCIEGNWEKDPPPLGVWGSFVAVGANTFLPT